MKNRKLIMFLHFIVLLAVLIGLIALFSRLRADWIFDNRSQSGGLLPLLLMLVATLPVSVCGQMAFGLLTGYKLKELSMPFVTFRPGQGVRFSGRIRIVLTMMPPEISSDIPFRLMTVGAPLTLLILSALLTPLALLLQTSPVSPWLLDAAQMCAIMMCIQLLPRKSQTDDLTLLFLMSRYPQMRLACAQNMAITAEPGAAFDKPDAWFTPYEMPLLRHPYPMSITIVYIARCIRQSRFAEAYPAVQAVLAIPDPATPFIIPCMLFYRIRRTPAYTKRMRLRPFAPRQIGFVVVALVTKIIGCGLTARLCKFNFNDSLKIGVGMMTRGEVALIVSQKGLAVGMLTPEYFTAVILLIIVSSISTPIILKVLYSKDKPEEVLN